MDGWVDGWVGGWVGGCKSRFKDCLQQSKINQSIVQPQIYIGKHINSSKCKIKKKDKKFKDNFHHLIHKNNVFEDLNKNLGSHGVW
jgi:hypothetical protein